MTLPPFCGSCGIYHAGPCTAIPVNRLAALRPPVPAKESAWGVWIAYLFIVGVLAYVVGGVWGLW